MGSQWNVPTAFSSCFSGRRVGAVRTISTYKRTLVACLWNVPLNHCLLNVPFGFVPVIGTICWSSFHLRLKKGDIFITLHPFLT